MPNEFLLVLHDGDAPETLDDLTSGTEQKPARTKGAYYKNIERKMLLKKKRANVSSLSAHAELALRRDCRCMSSTKTSGRSSASHMRR